MTVIAYRNGILATDSACTSNSGVMLGTVQKVARAPDGTLVAAAGKSTVCAAVLAWVTKGMKGRLDFAAGSFDAIIVRPDATVHHLGPDGAMMQIHAPYHAEGSGYQLALAAMEMGADPERAVQVACKLSGDCREPVQILRLGDPA